MFGSRTLTPTEALRYYADTRRKTVRSAWDCLDSARRFSLAYRRYYALRAIEWAQHCIALLEFMLNHTEELPTDAATIEVLRKDLADMKAVVDKARMYLANPFDSFPE